MGKSSLAYLISNIIWALVPYALLPILARYLSVSDMGIISIFTIFVQIFSSLIGVNCHAALQSHYFKLSQDEFHEYFSNMLTIIFSNFFLISVFSSLVYWALNGETWGINYPIFMTTIFLGLLQFLISLYFSILQIQNKAIQYAFVQIIQALLNGFIALAWVVLINQSYLARIWGIFIASLLIIIILVLIIHRQFKPKWRYNYNHVKRILQFGLPLMPHTIGSLIIASLDRNIVAALMGIEQAGYYGVCLQIALGLSLVADAFNKAYAPWIYKKLAVNDAQARLEIKKSIILYGALWIISVAVLIIFAPLIIQIFAGDKYQDYYQILQILFVGMGFGGLYYLATNIVFFAEKTGILSIISLVCGGINIILAFYLISNYGAIGGAFAYSITQLLVLIAVNFLAIKTFSRGHNG